MELEKIDFDLLNAIYEKDYKNSKIIWDDMGFESINHRAFHIKRLERLDLISIDDNTLISGGRKDPKYGTAVAMIWSDGLHVKDKGFEVLKSKQT